MTLFANWKVIEALQKCPACEKKAFKYHSNYNKFHYNEQIQILVLKCTACGKHHAVIPSFSLPGTSLGTKEVEEFYYKRYILQLSRKKAGQKIIELDFKEKHLKRIEIMITRCIARMKAFFPDMNRDILIGIHWVKAFLNSSDPENFITRLNHYCLTRNVNAVFYSRINILHFSKKKPGVYFSNNIGSIPDTDAGLDSS